MREGQGEDAVGTLTGRPDTSVMAHHPGEQDAAVDVSLGGVSIKIWDVSTALRIVDVFDQLTRGALARLPVESRPTIGGSVPEVVICAVQASAVSGRIVQHSDGDRAVVRIGRLILHLRDREAFGAVSAVFRESLIVANTAFAQITLPAQRSAVETASRVFASHRARRTSGSRTMRTGRAWPPAAPSPGRSNTGERQLE
ncbi:hypothetical protein [Pseudonocardia sp. GCM10023141]|uniref:hypothetical protein n=1 Tax=Pseudonocardia sp. GCM10023141 TaxID=3252653 RepID=UPI003623B189